MSTPYQNWITETNAAADNGQSLLAERLEARLLERSGPPPTADDINWLDLIMDSYANADEPVRPAYAKVMLDWLGEFQRAFGRTTISDRMVTLACSALSFWQACPGAFKEGEHAHIRAFLGAYLDKAVAFAKLPAPLNDAGGKLHEQIMRLHYSGPGSEHLPKEALLGRWQRVPQDGPELSRAQTSLRNNRSIMEAMALNHPNAVGYDLVHNLFRQSKALPEGERNAFLEHTFTNMDLAEPWAQVTDGNPQPPKDRFFAELRKRFSPDDFESIDETLRFIDQVFWLAGDEQGDFAQWKRGARELAIMFATRFHEKEIVSLDHLHAHVLQSHDKQSSFEESIGRLVELLIYCQILYHDLGRVAESRRAEEWRVSLLRYLLYLRSGIALSG